MALPPRYPSSDDIRAGVARPAVAPAWRRAVATHMDEAQKVQRTDEVTRGVSRSGPWRGVPLGACSAELGGFRCRNPGDLGFDLPFDHQFDHGVDLPFGCCSADSAEKAHRWRECGDSAFQRSLRHLEVGT